MTAVPAARIATEAALAEAGLAPGDLQCAELYAPGTITEVLVSEAIGQFARGHGARAAAEGRTGPGGDVPLNTSGGCLARGHPPSLTALYGLLELREQLLGRAGARQVAGARAALHVCELWQLQRGAGARAGARRMSLAIVGAAATVHPTHVVEKYQPPQ